MIKLTTSYQYAVGLLFDAYTTTIIRSIWQTLAERGISSQLAEPGSFPHLSLMCCSEISIDPLEEQLTQFCRFRVPMPVHFQSYGLFPNKKTVVFLSPTVTPDLLRLHTDFFRLFRRYLINPSVHYLPGVWVPHSTLALQVKEEQIQLVMEVCGHFPHPLTGTVEGMVIVCLDPLETLGVFPFEGFKNIENSLG
jgi:2'-5' RNA ligase